MEGNAAIKRHLYIYFFRCSSEFCESHLQLLFTILEKSNFPTVRANTIIALGDLTFRFPNLIEPWTANLYARYPNNALSNIFVLSCSLLLKKKRDSTFSGLKF